MSKNADISTTRPQKKRKIAKGNLIKQPEATSCFSEDLFSRAESYRQYHDHVSTPYKHLVIENLCKDHRIQKIHDECVNNLSANFKETDLFKVYQTGDLTTIDKTDPSMILKIPNLLSLRDSLYSPEFRNFISEVTGCGELTDRYDCSSNAYANGCHLLCHDDVIGTRRVSYIIYISDPETPWTQDEGGSLELYPLDPSSICLIKDEITGTSTEQGIPASIPTTCILPTCNSMAIFAVQPGKSYHSVQEVFSTDRPRLSISGWYHGVNPPNGSDQASLKQIMTKGDEVDETPFTQVLPSKAFDQVRKQEGLSPEDLNILKAYINPTYLDANAITKIHRKFCKESCVQLKDFIRPDLAKVVISAARKVDKIDKLGRGKCPDGYSTGVTVGNSRVKGGDAWKLVGPPHKKRYLRFEESETTPDLVTTKSLKRNPGKWLSIFKRKLFRIPAFLRFLNIITSLKPIGFKDEVRRFRPGLDYTVAHYGVMTRVSRLDATLCFVDTENLAPSSQTDEVNLDDFDDDDFAELWEGGDVGGFECYIGADGQESAEAAEVYRADNPEEEESMLLSVSPAANTLSLVMRDPNVLRFVKYVSANAPGSRWDVAAEYELELTIGKDNTHTDSAEEGEDSGFDSENSETGDSDEDSEEDSEI